MQQIFSNTTLTVNQLIEKIDTGELGPSGTSEAVYLEGFKGA